jgi:adenylylsulfate kinase-like enzyme
VTLFTRSEENKVRERDMAGHQSSALSSSPVPVLVLTGPVGAGKSTVGSEIGRLLREASVSYAIVDLPRIGDAWPSSPDDPWNERLIHQNLACMWANFREAGASRLVICRVLEERSLLDRIREAVPGANITVVRLRVPLEVLQERLRAREHPLRADWYLNVATYLCEKMEKSPVEDHVVDNGDRYPDEVAKEVLGRLKWLE